MYSGTACRAADLVAQVVALAGREPFTPDGELVAGVMVEVAPGKVRATLGSPGASTGTRRLEAATCSELMEKLALVIVMALAVPEPRRASSAAREPARSTGAVHLDAIVVGAVSDRLWPQAYVGVRARRGWTSATLELAAEVPDSFAEGPGRVTIHRGAAMLAPCAHRGALSGCATLGAGILRGRGEGYMESRSAAMPLAVAGGRVAWEHAVTEHLRLHVRGEAGVVLTTNRFLVDDVVVWSARRFEGRLGIGVVGQFL